MKTIEIGDLVYDEVNKRHGIVLNNYRGTIYEKDGEIRLDSDGNRPIEDLKLVKTCTKKELNILKASARNLIISRLLRDDMDHYNYYHTAYIRLLNGEFDN